MLHNNSPRMGVPIKSQTSGCVGPTTYILCDGREKLPNRVPFLSTEKKEPSFIGRSFCDALYDVYDDNTIVGGTSPRYKTQRFMEAESGPVGPGYYDPDPPLKEVPPKSCRAGKGKLYLCPVPYTWSGDVQPRPPKRKERHVGPMTYHTEKKLYYGYYYGGGSRWSASRTRRKFYDAPDTPGPADYQVKQVKCPREQKDEEFREMARLLTYIPRYLDAQEMKAKRENLPGPGYYNVGKVDMCRRCDSINPRPFVTAKERFAASGDRGAPGPGTYEIVDVQYPVSKKFVPFSVQSDRFPHKAPATAPGPGEYMLKGSVQETLDNKKNWYMDVEPPFSTTATRNTLAISKYTLSIPSPAEYTVNLEKRCKLKVSSPFKSKTQRFPRPRHVMEASPAKYDTTPAYHALTNQKFHNVYEVPFNNFANPRTRGILDPMYVNYDNPAPDIYSPKTEFSCACHAITIPKSMRFADDDNGVPGPGTYWIHPIYDRSIYKAFTTQNLKLKEDVLKQKIKKHTNETYKKWATNLNKPKKMRWFVENDMKQNYFM